MFEYKADEKYRNRYGVEYWFEVVPKSESGLATQYQFFMPEDNGYGRVGGREGVDGIDMQNLGMFDPSGGPYISLGTIIEGKEVTRIRSTEQGYILEVEPIQFKQEYGIEKK